MSQAFNLSQFANKVNTSGQADLTTAVTGTLPVANGGSGQTSYTDGQLLIGNTTGNTLTKATLTAGSGITVTNGSGAITIASTASGGFSNMQVFTSPGTFTTPASTTRIKVTVVGGGGSGGNAATNTAAGGGGGGGAAIYVGPVSASTPYAVTVGAGGTAVAAPSGGNPGGTSSFGSLASATGGAGGTTASQSGVLGGLGSAGTLQFGGGVGGGRTLVVAPATFAAGFGGNSYLGGGGNTTTPGPGGVAGQAYGGGGSGAYNSPSLTNSGAGGVVVVEY